MAISLAPNRLQRMEHYCGSYGVVLPADTSLDAALKPEFWAHVGHTLRQHDTVRFIPEDMDAQGFEYAVALVLRASRGTATLKMIQYVERAADVAQEGPGELVDLYVKYNGPHDRHTVIRKSDGVKLKTGFIEKADAQRWLDDHLKSLGR